MKIRNEVKVGILGLISIFLLIWGYNFLKGRNILSSDLVIKARFATVSGLNVAAPVTIQGYIVGSVSGLYLQPEVVKRPGMPDSVVTYAIAELRIKKGTQIPKNAVAELIAPSLLSAKEVTVVYTGSCEGSGCLQTGETIEGRIPGMLDGIMTSAKPLLDTLGGKLTPVLDGVSQLGAKDGALQDVALIVDNVKLITDQVNNLLLSVSVNLSASMSNLKSITDNIKNSNNEITQMLGNVNSITKQIKDAELDKTLKEVKGTVENLNKMVSGLQGTLKKADGALDNITTLTDFSNKDGLITTLLNDKKFSGDVQLAVNDLQLLLQDIRLNPKRYFTVLSRRNRPYTPPTADPGHDKKK